MQNLKLLWANIADQGTLSGGSWQLPLANMQDKDINHAARSSGLSTAQTQFVIDLGADTSLFNALALVNINCTTDARIRIQTSNTSNFSVVDYDSGDMDVFRSIYTAADMLWKSGNWWKAKIQTQDLEGYVRNCFVDLNERENRYIKIMLSDTGNAAGYLDIGRLIVGRLTSFTHNFSYGFKLRWVDPSIKSRTIGSKSISEVRQKYRAATYSLDFITDREALTQAFELERIMGTTGEVFVVTDADDIMNLFRTSFLAQLSELSGIEKHMFGFNKTAYSFEEIL